MPDRCVAPPSVHYRYDCGYSNAVKLLYMGVDKQWWRLSRILNIRDAMEMTRPRPGSGLLEGVEMLAKGGQR